MTEDHQDATTRHSASPAGSGGQADPAPPTAIVRLAVALDGAGWHPGSWPTSPEEHRSLFTSSYWAQLAEVVERGEADLLTIEDFFGAPHGPAARGVERGRLDAVQVAASLAGRTHRVGLAPVATVTHTEPYHLATVLATLDFASVGRAGWQVRISASPDEARLSGLRTASTPAPTVELERALDPASAGVIDELFGEAAAIVEANRALWDSWEDDAEIRDVDSGRFLDADKLHHVDAHTPWFSIAGPSIVPRPPQGHVLVTGLAHAWAPYLLAARAFDVVFVTPVPQTGASPRTVGEAAVDIRAELDAASAEVGRRRPRLRALGDVVVLIDDSREAAQARLARLDAVAPLRSDAHVLAGTAADVADLVQQWATAGLDGVRLRPAEHAIDLPAIADRLVPELRARGLRPPAGSPPPGTLRETFGLARPENRFARSHGEPPVAPEAEGGADSAPQQTTTPALTGASR